MTDNTNYEKLFEIFPTISTKEWEDVIMEDLKGADYEKKLIWNSIEGLKIKPYYRKEDLINDFPIYNSGLKTNNNWEICQEIYSSDKKEIINTILSSSDKGINSISFNIDINSKSELLEIFDVIDFDNLSVYFNMPEKEELIADCLFEIANRKKITDIKGCLGFNPLGFLTINGRYYKNTEDWTKIYILLNEKLSRFKSLRILNISGNYFHNAGSSITQDLAFSFNMFVEYIEELKRIDLKPENVYNKFSFTYSVGSNYFLEVAKLRAARHIWTKVLESYNISIDSSIMNIYSETSKWTVSLYDPYVNMLRATTEAMSAIIGGANILSVTPFDIAYKKQNEFSSRIARNIQIILKGESSLDMVVDPSKGSYFIENITNELIDKSWNLFIETEDNGGYKKSLENLFIKNNIDKVLEKKLLNISSKSEIILGTNQYPNQKEAMLKNIEIASNKNINEKEIINPIGQYRASEEFEKLRLRTENSSKSTPKVFLFTYGNLAMRKARASFSSNFFACAGFEIIDNAGFKTIDDGIESVKKIEPEITVLCSSDDEYPQLVPNIFEAIKNNTILVLAGFPKEQIEEYKKIGLTNFIHVKSNLLDTLSDFQNKLNL